MTELGSSNAEPVKVFQLAKELGMDSFTLLDQLRDLKIEVKNHMSDLLPEQMELVKQALQSKTSGTKKAKPATATKKASATKPTAVTRKKAPAAPSAPAKQEAPQAAMSASAQATPTSSTVIRRRQISENQSEIVRTITTTEKHAHSAPVLPVEEPVAPPPVEIAEVQDPVVEVAETIQAVEVIEAAEPVVAPAPVEAPVTEVKTSAVVPGVGLTTTTTITHTTPTGTRVTQRRSVLNVVSPSAAPKSLIRTVTPAPPKNTVIVKPTGTPSAAGDLAKGGRIIKMTKEKLDKLAEEEAARKKGGAREQLKPEDVRFADYRKKEMVFLPRKKKIPVGKEMKRTQITKRGAQKRVVEMGETITVGNLADQLGVKAAEVIRKLMSLGTMATVNQSLDPDTATVIAQEYQYEIRNTAFQEASVLTASPDDAAALKSRPPVVTIMGHVDHGKTTLLDSIRNANVAAGEAGGITQHIGAYTVDRAGQKISFIDTPGHEAFTMMRARGANVTDIVILVVAADDGVMPQTREALSHAKAAGVPIIVAVNKIDKPGANPERIKQALAELDLLAEDWGGQTMFVPVSALKKEGIDALLDAILLNAEMLDLKANADARASGVVLESRLEKGRGPAATVLVRRGTLHVGDYGVSGVASGRIKALTDHEGRSIESVGPGMAAGILGLDVVPGAGDPFDIVEDEADARRLVQHRAEKERAKAQLVTSSSGKMSLDALFAKIKSGEAKELKIVLKADMMGSVEAVRDSLNKLTSEKVKVNVILAAAGGVTESDVLLASASQAIIVGFNVRPETKARAVAEAEHVDVKCYNIIYELVDEVKKAMTGMLDKKKVEQYLGRAEVRQTFTVPSSGTIAGCFVIDGKVQRGAQVRLLRDSRIIVEGKMSSLRRFKDDAREVAQGYECGIGIERFNDIKQGDIIEAFEIQLVTPELEFGMAANPPGKQA